MSFLCLAADVAGAIVARTRDEDRRIWQRPWARRAIRARPAKSRIPVRGPPCGWSGLKALPRAPAAVSAGCRRTSSPRSSHFLDGFVPNAQTASGALRLHPACRGGDRAFYGVDLALLAELRAHLGGCIENKNRLGSRRGAAKAGACTRAIQPSKTLRTVRIAVPLRVLHRFEMRAWRSLRKRRRSGRRDPSIDRPRTGTAPRECAPQAHGLDRKAA